MNEVECQASIRLTYFNIFDLICGGRFAVVTKHMALFKSNFSHTNQGQISSTFYAKLIHAQILKAQKYTDDLNEFLCFCDLWV